MLLGKFFTVSDKQVTETNVLATIEFNAAHPIFEGHFPEQPVVPGVCMLQLFKELLETTIDQKTQLNKADHLKFLAVINPLENKTVQAEFSYEKKSDDGITVTGRLFNDAVTFLKFRGIFSPQ